jgi:hypothetical protein
VFITCETDTNVGRSFAGQLAEFLLQFKEQTMGIHEFFFLGWVTRLDIFLKMGNSLNNYVITSNMIFLANLL